MFRVVGLLHAPPPLGFREAPIIAVIALSWEYVGGAQGFRNISFNPFTLCPSWAQIEKLPKDALIQFASVRLVTSRNRIRARCCGRVLGSCNTFTENSLFHTDERSRFC